MALSRTARAALALFSVLLLEGCARCSDEPRVPFKLHPRRAVEDAGAPVVAEEDAAAQLPHVFLPPVDAPELEGSAIALGGVHALLESDLDQDGDRDLLALSEDDRQQPRLYVLTREPAGFGTPREVPAFGQDAPGCALVSARVDALSAGKAVASVARACSAEADERAPRSSLALLSLEQTPRVHERLEVVAARPDGAPALDLAAHGRDADGDGHDDVAIRVGLGGGPDEQLELVWLDRPSGLLRDRREPDAALSAWASAAQTLAAKEPERALARAELGLALARALCRELGEPVVRLTSGAGIACGPLKSRALLLATVARAHARSGDVLRAFEAYRALRAAEPAPGEKLLAEVEGALSRLTPAAGISLRRIGPVEPLRAPRVHLPAARFLSDDVLYVRRAPPVLVDLVAGEERRAPGEPDELVRDPSGRLIATAIERGCEGFAVRIERAPPRGSDYVGSKAIAHAPLAPSAAASVGCGPHATRVDDGGFSLLGWAPQGILAARGSDLRILPIAADGRPLGPPRLLAPSAPRPAPLPAGRATTDAARYVEATPAGVLVYGPVSTDVALWRPEGYTTIARGPLEVAISPTARRVALSAGGSVYVLERAR